jgi:hypothetical protein
MVLCGWNLSRYFGVIGGSTDHANRRTLENGVGDEDLHRTFTIKHYLFWTKHHRDLMTLGQLRCWSTIARSNDNLCAIKKLNTSARTI